MDDVRSISVERAGISRLFLYTGLLLAAVIGYMVVVNIGMTFGFVAALALFGLVVLRPAGLIPVLVILSIFIESALRSVTISVGGQELLNFNGVVNCSLVGATLLYIIAGRIRPFQSHISRSFLLYCAAVALSLVFSVDAMLTVRSLVRIAAAYCIYLIITQFLTDRRRLDRVFQLLVMLSAVPITMGLYQIVFVNHFVVSRAMRTGGTFATSMSYAMYLALILPYVFGQIFFSRAGAVKKGLFCVLFLAGLVNLVYNPTRIAWGVFTFTMVSYGILTNARKFFPPIMILLVLVVVIFFPFLKRQFGGYFMTDWRTYFSNDTGWDIKSADYIAASSLHIRVFVWRHMLHDVADNVLFGRGSGTWFDAQDRKAIGFPIASHSDYFEVLYGTGILGLWLYLVFRIRQLTLLARFARSDVEIDVKRTVLYPCLLTHIGCLGMSVTEVWQSYSGIYWLSWITFAISETCYNIYRVGQSPSSPAFETTQRDMNDVGAGLSPGEAD
jgi:hypothetical protein